ncbi:MAG: acyl carrier protein phosphodiesterase [Methanomicrobiales archaeon]|nr:acyl carrier protein phosphodiesterase [Methanomicrobiales archaeon]
MTKISQLCSRLIDLIGEETIYRELEGILRKHQGIAHRTRKPGRVSQCLSTIKDRKEQGMNLTPRMIAGILLQYNLSPASLYRLVRILHLQGEKIRAVDILREQERIKAGVY